MPVLNPYLNFDGNCKEAFDFYAKVFKTEPVMVMKFDQVPAEFQEDPSESDLIMHIAIPVGGGVLMGSDRPKKYRHGGFGNMSYISIGAKTEEEARSLFAELSEGGKVSMPLDWAFWGDLFAMWQDKFGVSWMISYRKIS